MTEEDFNEKKADLDEIIALAKARKERAGKAEADAKKPATEVDTHVARTEAAASEARFSHMLTIFRARRKEVDRTPMPDDQKKELEARLDEIDGLLKDEHVAPRGGVTMPPPMPWAGNDEPTHPHVDALPDRPGFASARTVPGKAAEPVPVAASNVAVHPEHAKKGHG